MKAMSADAVKRMALAHGGKVSIDGRTVNSARLQVVTGPKPPVQPAYMPEQPLAPEQKRIEPTPDPAIREALVSIDNYAAGQFLLTEQNQRLLMAVKEMLQREPAAHPSRPTKWVFTVKRDAQGLMETITASAKE